MSSSLKLPSSHPKPLTKPSKLFIFTFLLFFMFPLVHVVWVQIIGWWLGEKEKCASLWTSLNHSLEQLVDLVLAIAEVAAVDVVVVLLAPSAGRCVQLEGPEEVVDLLEDASDGEQLVDHVFDALHVVAVTQLALDNEVIGDGNATAAVLEVKIGEWSEPSLMDVSTHLNESAFVEQVAGGLQRWIAVGDVRLGNAQHVECRLVELHERGVVDLTQAEKVQNLLDLRRDFVDTDRRCRRVES